MEQVVLIIHLVLAVLLIGVVMLQRSEGGALGIGGGANGLMSGRAVGNVLTRATSLLATGFMLSSLVLAISASANRSASSILDTEIIQESDSSKGDETQDESQPSVPSFE